MNPKSSELVLVSVVVTETERIETYESATSRQVHIHPILTEEERAKRMKNIHDAACRLWVAEERRKANLGQQEVRG